MSIYGRETRYLSKDTSDCTKGIFSILVLMHHLCQKTLIVNEIKVLCCFFNEIGHLSVSVFFFLSGYGLIISQKRNEDKYIDDFPNKRIYPFYCIEIMLIIMYSIYRLLVGSTISFNLLVKSLLFGGTVIQNGWYLQVQLIFYIYFYFAFKYIKPKPFRYLFLFILICLQCVILYFLNFGAWWYRSCPSFLLGFFWAEQQNNINKIVVSVHKWVTALVLSFALFFLVFILSRTMPAVTLSYDLFFVVFVVLFISRANIAFSLTRWLGKYSFEIYVLQGLFLNGYHEIINIQNDYLYLLLVVFSCLVASVFLHPIVQGIYTFARKQL